MRVPLEGSFQDLKEGLAFVAGLGHEAAQCMIRATVG